MKILHTADWHIGQYFFGYNRKDEHIYFLNWLKNVILDIKADVLLVAGDVFDSPNPSAESQKIYYRFLREVTVAHPQLQIIIIAGNHDSASRLEAPNPLFEDMNIHIKGLIPKDRDGTVDYNSLFIPLQEAGRTIAWCIAVPYLRQGDYPVCESYAKGIKLMYETLYTEIQRINDADLPIVLMGHLQATGSELSDNDRSERTIIGGLEAVSPEVFDMDGIVYAALGHLHKAQRVSGREHVRYAGSPLPMSFTEKNYRQGINLILMDASGIGKIERIDFAPPVKLMSIPNEPQPLAVVLEEIARLPDGAVRADSPYLELKVLITEPEPSMRHQIEVSLQNKQVRLAVAVPYKVSKERSAGAVTYEAVKALTPMDMAREVFREKYGNEMPSNMESLLETVIREVER